MTNLYDFLRRVLADATGAPPYSLNVTPEDLKWIRQYLAEPDNQIHFKSRKIAVEFGTGHPVYAQDYAIAGADVDIFCLLTEAMMANGTFADLVVKAAQFFIDHVPMCPSCSDAVRRSQEGEKDWKFTPHKPV